MSADCERPGAVAWGDWEWVDAPDSDPLRVGSSHVGSDLLHGGHYDGGGGVRVEPPPLRRVDLLYTSREARRRRPPGQRPTLRDRQGPYFEMARAGAALWPALVIAIFCRLLPTNSLATAIASVAASMVLLGFRRTLSFHHVVGLSLGLRAVACLVASTGFSLSVDTSEDTSAKAGGLCHAAWWVASFACVLLIGTVVGSWTWVVMDAKVGPYLRRRYISTVNGGSVRGVEAHEGLWAMAVAPFYALSSGLSFALRGWWCCLQANMAAVVVTIVFHILCYMGADHPCDHRNLGAWGRPLPDPAASPRRHAPHRQRRRTRRPPQDRLVP